MIYHLSLSANAETDLIESALWYRSHKSGLGKKFIQQAELYFLRIQNNPFHFPAKKRNFSEAFIRKFSYVIIHEIIESENVVFSVFNTSQNPQ
ncbi:type II toxin-antitoxin system RelE/ParE family toxin [Chryseobacterium sp. Leaf201]|uniref:type II toxin-antitoxin system RelE/ParE family toxin n=1 Tax=Chryseobacterium sp. Leaf201 TaxID=1735672 RepID=UPI000AF1F8E1|nr:type II toxin-antitoxin system RelE/ParE family toxin [Chryseobacterium sp. Leaf201]